MKKVLHSLGPSAHRLIRLMYLIVIIVLAVFAYRTWQELQALRTAPVALPNFWFNIVGDTGQQRINANGTWLAPSTATKAPGTGRLQTSAIECSQARMQCLESVATVDSMMNKSFMEAHTRIYDVEQWNEREVVTRILQIDKCRMQVITLNPAEKAVTAQVTLPADRTTELCPGVPAALRLEDGSRLLERMKR